MKLGKEFIGEINPDRTKYFKDGSIKELYSKDGLRTFRAPTLKNDGRFDANFEILKDGIDPTYIKGQVNKFKNSDNYTNTHVAVQQIKT